MTAQNANFVRPGAADEARRRDDPILAGRGQRRLGVAVGRAGGVEAPEGAGTKESGTANDEQNVRGQYGRRRGGRGGRGSERLWSGVRVIRRDGERWSQRVGANYCTSTGSRGRGRQKDLDYGGFHGRRSEADLSGRYHWQWKDWWTGLGIDDAQMAARAGIPVGHPTRAGYTVHHWAPDSACAAGNFDGRRLRGCHRSADAWQWPTRGAHARLYQPLSTRRWVAYSTGASGLRWLYAGTDSMTVSGTARGARGISGVRLTHIGLASALAARTQAGQEEVSFNQAELLGFNLPTLTPSHFIQTGERYFRPQPVDMNDMNTGVRWCRWGGAKGKHSDLWMQSSIYTGIRTPPWSSRVRSWNRYLAIARGPVKMKASRASMWLRMGQRIWKLREQIRLAGALSRGGEDLRWHDQPTISSYDRTHVIYAEIPMDGGHSFYIGETSKSAWARRMDRLTKVRSAGAARERLAPFEMHLHRAGSYAAMNRHVLLVLEHVPPPDERDFGREWSQLDTTSRPKSGRQVRAPSLAAALAQGLRRFSAAEWAAFRIADLRRHDWVEANGSYYRPVDAWRARIAPYEQWWIRTLRTETWRGGFNVEHSVRRKDGVFSAPRAAHHSSFDARRWAKSAEDFRRAATGARGPGKGGPSRWRRQKQREGRAPIWNPVPPAHPRQPRMARAPRLRPDGSRPTHRGRRGGAGARLFMQGTAMTRLATAHRASVGRWLQKYVENLGNGTLRALLRVATDVSTRVTSLPAGLVMGRVMDIRTMAMRTLTNRVSASSSASCRPLIVSAYVGAITEGLQLQRLIQSKATMSLVPGAIWRKVGVPLVVNKFYRTVGEVVFNFAATAREGVAEGFSCQCHLPQFRPYCNSSGHVVTKDLSIVRDARLRELLRRGPKYRELVCDLLVPPDVDHPTTRDKVEYTIECSLRKFIKEQEKRHDVDPMVFQAAWQSEILRQTYGFLDTVDEATWQRLEESLARQPTWLSECESAITELRESYVVGVADKETGTVTITCKTAWRDAVCSELQTGPAYAYVGVADTVAEPCVVRAPPCVTWDIPVFHGALEITEAQRIARARSAFGVLHLAIGPAYTPGQVQRAAEEIRDKLRFEEQRVRFHVMHGGHSKLMHAGNAARERIGQAVQQLLQPARQEAYRRSLLSDADRMNPVITRVRCPIDVAGLHALRAESTNAQHITDVDNLLRAATIVADVAPAAGYIDLIYRFRGAGVILVDAGVISGTRFSADGVDPFNMNKAIRAAALRRFGIDFDDDGSHPRAAACVCRSRARTLFLADNNREHVMQQLGDYFLAGHARELGLAADAVQKLRRKIVKQLINAAQNGSSVEAWCAMWGVPAHRRLSDLNGDGCAVLPTGGGTRLSLTTLFAELRAYSRYVAQELPRADALLTSWSRWAGRAPSAVDSTLCYWVNSEYEFASLMTKVDVLNRFGYRGTRVLNLQWDGVVAAPGDIAPAALADVMSDACRRRLAYRQPVAVKAMDGAPAQVDPVEWLSGVTTCNAAGTTTLLHRIMRKQFAYLEPRKYAQTDGPKRRKQVEDKDAPKDSLSLFLRNRSLSYLYATVKTHRDPFGWRFIAGGHFVTMSAISKAQHLVLQALLPDLHLMHVEAVVGLPHAGECASAWPVRDTRDVVRRVQYVERRIREDVRAGMPRRAVQAGVHDFTNLYTTLPHDAIRTEVMAVVAEAFSRHADDQGVLPWLVIRRDGTVEWYAPSRGATLPADGSKDAGDKKSGRFFDVARIAEELEFVLDNIYVTFGTAVYRQTLGIPMGFSSSPMLAIFMLSSFELRWLRHWVHAVRTSPDAPVADTPWGALPWSEMRVRMASLVGRVARCCRMIDDVLLLDLSSAEREWVLRGMYPQSLELKEASATPGAVEYMDVLITTDRGGLHTRHFDKRIELQRRGMMTSVMKYPHIESALTDQCKYSCLYAFMYACYRRIMRRHHFIRTIAERIADMTRDEYSLRGLQRVAQRFIARVFRPRELGAHVRRCIERLTMHQLAVSPPAPLPRMPSHTPPPTPPPPPRAPSQQPIYSSPRTPVASRRRAAFGLHSTRRPAGLPPSLVTPPPPPPSPPQPTPDTIPAADDDGDTLQAQAIDTDIVDGLVFRSQLWGADAFSTDYAALRTGEVDIDVVDGMLFRSQHMYTPATETITLDATAAVDENTVTVDGAAPGDVVVMVVEARAVDTITLDATSIREDAVAVETITLDATAAVDENTVNVDGAVVDGADSTDLPSLVDGFIASLGPGPPPPPPPPLCRYPWQFPSWYRNSCYVDAPLAVWECLQWWTGDLVGASFTPMPFLWHKIDSEVVTGVPAVWPVIHVDIQTPLLRLWDSRCALRLSCDSTARRDRLVRVMRTQRELIREQVLRLILPGQPRLPGQPQLPTLSSFDTSQLPTERVFKRNVHKAMGWYGPGQKTLELLLPATSVPLDIFFRFGRVRTCNACNHIFWPAGEHKSTWWLRQQQYVELCRDDVVSSEGDVWRALASVMLRTRSTPASDRLCPLCMVQQPTCHEWIYSPNAQFIWANLATQAQGQARTLRADCCTLQLHGVQCQFAVVAVLLWGNGHYIADICVQQSTRWIRCDGAHGGGYATDIPGPAARVVHAGTEYVVVSAIWRRTPQPPPPPPPPPPTPPPPPPLLHVPPPPPPPTMAAHVIDEADDDDDGAGVGILPRGTGIVRPARSTPLLPTTAMPRPTPKSQPMARQAEVKAWADGDDDGAGDGILQRGTGAVRSSRSTPLLPTTTVPQPTPTSQPITQQAERSVPLQMPTSPRTAQPDARARRVVFDDVSEVRTYVVWQDSSGRAGTAHVRKAKHASSHSKPYGVSRLSGARMPTPAAEAALRASDRDAQVRSRPASPPPSSTSRTADVEWRETNNKTDAAAPTPPREAMPATDARTEAERRAARSRRFGTTAATPTSGTARSQPFEHTTTTTRGETGTDARAAARTARSRRESTAASSAARAPPAERPESLADMCGRAAARHHAEHRRRAADNAAAAASEATSRSAAHARQRQARGQARERARQRTADDNRRRRAGGDAHRDAKAAWWEAFWREGGAAWWQTWQRDHEARKAAAAATRPRSIDETMERNLRRVLDTEAAEVAVAEWRTLATAGAEQARVAYRRLARRVHPDKLACEEATEMMQALVHRLQERGF